MNFTGVYIVIIIACLYSLFANKLADYALNKRALDDKCSYRFILNENSSLSERTKRAECDKEREDYSRNRTTLMVILGLLGLFAGVYGASNGTENSFVPTCGLALGGGFVMINFIAENWSTMSDGYRLMLITGALAGLIYGGSKMSVANVY